MFDYVEEKLESLVKVIFWLLSIIYVIGFFVYSFMISSTIDALFWRSDDGIGFTKFVFIVFGLIVTAAFIAINYIFTLMVLSYLNLVSFSRITANTVEQIEEKIDSLKGYSKPVAVANSIQSVKNNEWKCVKCGKINPNFVGTCGCGQSRV